MNAIDRPSKPVTSAVEPVKAVLTVISTYMDLGPGRTFLDYERWEPPTKGAYLVGGYLRPSEPVSNNKYLDATGQEVDEAVFAHHIQYDLMSIIPDDTARLNKEMPPLALRSNYASNYFTKAGIGVAWVQSALEDTSRVLPGDENYQNRYTAGVIVYALHQFKPPSGYFDSFQPINLWTQSGQVKKIPFTNPKPGG